MQHPEHVQILWMHKVVLLALMATQKDVLRKGVSFIPKPEKFNIHLLHNDLNSFMHRMKCKFKLYHKQQQTQRPICNMKTSPERLTDNGTLDTFLHRVGFEIMNEHKHKQNKPDNLTRQERQALNQPNINCKQSR